MSVTVEFKAECIQACIDDLEREYGEARTKTERKSILAQMSFQRQCLARLAYKPQSGGKGEGHGLQGVYENVVAAESGLAGRPGTWSGAEAYPCEAR